MELIVEHIDASGHLHNLNINISKLAIIKHLAVAGQGFQPRLNKLMRVLGFFFHYRGYLESQSLRNNCFSQPPDILYDPTETAQFSNLIGKAFADFLSKHINRSFATYNYEAVMRLLRMPITGQRSDLIAFNAQHLFSIEAKGYSSNTISLNRMNGIKNRANSGPINVNFSMASVSYNLYSQVKVKYHDPINKEIPYNKDLLAKTSSFYYQGIYEYVNEEVFRIEDYKYRNVNYFRIRLNSLSDNLFLNHRKFYPFCIFPFTIDNISILMDKRIKKYITNGIHDVRMEQIQEEKNIYIDTDGVGLLVE